jgi:hypothetical protein
MISIRKLKLPFTLLIQAGLILGIAYFSLNLKNVDLSVPFNYGGDSIVALMFVKSMLINGWTWEIPQLSAPYSMSAAAFPVMTNFDWMIMKVMSIFSSDAGLLLNSFWLLTLTLSGWAVTTSLRYIGINLSLAFCAGVLYAFLPYALLRNVAHINLVYYLVPILSLMSIEIATGCPNYRRRGLTIAMSSARF